MMRVLGLDPGLRNTGWGVIEAEANRLRHVANGVVLAERLLQLAEGIEEVLRSYYPSDAAVETSLSNKNPASTLKLGMARAVSLLSPARLGIPVGEYLPMIVKKAVVGTGHADKEQVQTMVRHMLPGCEIVAADAADALAVAICHAHHLSTAQRWVGGGPRGAMDPVRPA
jgi:crossover junction endodeoxyribonuclease RuvC